MPVRPVTFENGNCDKDVMLLETKIWYAADSSNQGQLHWWPVEPLITHTCCRSCCCLDKQYTAVQALKPMPDMQSVS